MPPMCVQFWKNAVLWITGLVSGWTRSGHQTACEQALNSQRPSFHSIIDQGIYGVVQTSSQPILSLMRSLSTRSPIAVRGTFLPSINSADRMR